MSHISKTDSVFKPRKQGMPATSLNYTDLLIINPNLLHTHFKCLCDKFIKNRKSFNRILVIGLTIYLKCHKISGLPELNQLEASLENIPLLV